MFYPFGVLIYVAGSCSHAFNSLHFFLSFQEKASRHPVGLVQRRDSRSKPVAKSQALSSGDQTARPPAEQQSTIATLDPSGGRLEQKESHADVLSSLCSRKSAKKVKMKMGKKVAGIATEAGAARVLYVSSAPTVSAPTKKRRVTIAPVKCSSAAQEQLKEWPPVF
jgi:hypothetical protein